MSIFSLFRSLRDRYTQAEAEDVNPRVAAGKKAAATSKARYGENYHSLISGKAHEAKAAKKAEKSNGTGLTQSAAVKVHATRVERYGKKGYVEAGKKAQATMEAKMGVEGLKKHRKAIGSKGGSAPHSVPRGFAADPAKAAAAGRVGGQKSRRAKIVPGIRQLPNGRYHVRKTYNGVRVSIGTFETMDKARRALRKYEVAA